jgi:thiol-disulfide isomerase/thioredoxin
LLLWLFSSLLPVSGGEYGAFSENPDLPDYSQGFDPARDPFVDGDNALRLARESGRRVLIEAGGEWCMYCKRLDHYIHGNPMVREALYKNFVVLKVNISDKNDNREFMAKIHAYPHFFITESDGTLIHSQDTSRFLHRGVYSESLILEFIDKWGSDN